MIPFPMLKMVCKWEKSVKIRLRPKKAKNKKDWFVNNAANKPWNLRLETHIRWKVAIFLVSLLRILCLFTFRKLKFEIVKSQIKKFKINRDDLCLWFVNYSWLKSYERTIRISILFKHHRSTWRFLLKMNIFLHWM